MNLSTTARRIATVAGAATVLAGAAAGIASASTGQPNPQPHPTFTFQPPHGNQHRCNPLYAAYDGFQVNGNGYALVAGGASIPGFSQVQGTRRPQGCGQFWFAPQGGNTDKSAVLTDGNGNPGTQVIAEGRGRRLVIETGNGSSSQEWTFDGTGWANGQTGDIISIDTHGRASLQPSGTPASMNNTFTFTPAH